MATRVMMQLLILVLVSTIFSTYQVLGERDCYAEKNLVKQFCILTLAKGYNYFPPITTCRQVVYQSDTVCICRVLTREDEATINAAKLVRLVRECGKPVPPVGEKCGSKYSTHYCFK
ncbi:hypothetical protein HU200_033017 [Digitaria exilis]|uniref:Bifunctional inhibitor/plant lipid transfer protein/seed storage helical domain-containing protein n=1 Tax=Digitaria exilis TaxID=1010633 RepID=A0A835BMA8_9POAL|nr:hypothetical protein HU200_033017 [Digitaria exilis]